MGALAVITYAGVATSKLLGAVSERLSGANRRSYRWVPGLAATRYEIARPRIECYRIASRSKGSV